MNCRKENLDKVKQPTKLVLGKLFLVNYLKMIKSSSSKTHKTMVE